MSDEELDRERDFAIRDAWHAARNACLVPPDGGEPDPRDVAMCDKAADAVLRLLGTRPLHRQEWARAEVWVANNRRVRSQG